MRNNNLQNELHSLKQPQNNYHAFAKQHDPEWNFQTVNSVYQLARDPTLYRPQQQTVIQSQKCDHFAGRQAYSYAQKQPSLSKINYRPCEQHNQITTYQMKIPKNHSSKSNSETNVVSQSQSLEYLSSQQPSFSNKGEFTVCEDFNIDLISPVKSTHNFKKELQLASFSYKNQKQNLTLQEKCMKIYEFVQELKFMKLGFESKLKQQKVTFSNEIQQVKKLLFKLNIKYEKQILEYSQKQTRPMSRQSSMRQSSIREENGLQNQLIELKNYCKRLEQQKTRSEQKYQSTLKKYQQQIELISEQFQKKLQLERSSHLPSFSQQPIQCANCTNKNSQRQQKGIEAYEIQIWKNRLAQEQQNHSRAMRRLQEKVLMFQDEFQILQKSKNQSEKSLKQKQKQIVYRQAQIQYKLKDFQRRQRDLSMTEALLQKQKQQLERKKDKIADYELKVLKEERKQKNEVKDKQIMSSEYFNNCEKKRILAKGQPDRSDSLSSKSSRIDINARLKEIQMMRNRSSRNIDDNTSRNSSRDSRTSGYKDYATSRVTLTGRNLQDYGISPSTSVTPKQLPRGNSQTIKLSQKLNKLTENLQRQLRQMN